MPLDNSADKSSCIQQDLYTGCELVLLWNQPADAALCESFLSAFPYCTILETLDNYMLIQVPDSHNLFDTLSRIKAHPGITAADPNYPIAPASSDVLAEPSDVTTISIDEYVASAVKNLSDGLLSYHTDFTPVREIIIAVADTGIDIQHPSLTNFIWVNSEEIPGDGIDNDENGYIDDINGWDFYHNDASVCHYTSAETALGYGAMPEDNDNHGTHVAGIIVSTLRGGNLFSTEATPAPVKIMPLKIHGGEKATGSVANAIKAIKYAVMMNADICNISWGSSAITSSITTLEQTIRESGLLFVTAAGNTGSDNDLTPVYPASFRMDNVISVAFVNSYGLLTAKSNYGAQSVDLAAPGTDIYSTVVGDFAYMSGSSMAVPYVSAVSALLYSCRDNLYPAAVRELLLSTTQALPYESNTVLPNSMSYAQDKLVVPGIPNLSFALTLTEQMNTDETPPVLSATTTYTKDFICLNVAADDGDGSGIRVLKYASGKKNTAAFRRGTAGTTLPSTGIRLAKPGTYTIYASDYAGNETVLHHYFEDDTIPPVIIPSLHLSPSGRSFQVIAEIYDTESSIAAAYLAIGVHDEASFPFPEAQALPITKQRINLRLDASACYTICAVDIRGNQTIMLLSPSPEQPDAKDSEESPID